MHYVFVARLPSTSRQSFVFCAIFVAILNFMKITKGQPDDATDDLRHKHEVLITRFRSTTHRGLWKSVKCGLCVFVQLHGKS